jgi:hypothetical protein
MPLLQPRKMEDVTLKCDECGKEFKPGNRPDGAPNGIGLKLQNGTVYTICADCVMRMTPERAAEIKKRGGYDADACENTCEIERKSNDMISRGEMPSAEPERPEQPESAEEYCAECNHIEMCRWYPYEGCEFRSLPSAQLPRMSDDDINTIRIHLSALYESLCNQHRYREAKEYDGLIARFLTFAQDRPEPVKWLRDEFGSRCGACGRYAYRDKFGKPWESDFCPNCGAKMEVER